MRRIASLFSLVLMVALMGIAPAAAGDDCNTYRHHSGYVPGLYDYGVFIEHDFDTLTVYTQGQDIYVPPPEGRRSWDKVKKCKIVATTTTTVPPTTTTSSTTTTTVPVTTTVPPTTTTVPETTTSSSTSTTEPLITSTSSSTTTTSGMSSTTSQPPPSTTVPQTTTIGLVTTTTVPTLPDTGFSTLVFAGLAGMFLLIGAFLLGLARSHNATNQR